MRLPNLLAPKLTYQPYPPLRKTSLDNTPRLLIRGICYLHPQKLNLSDHITIIRLVGRFLEHARIMLFHNGVQEQIYLPSADWMERNLYRRIGKVFPVYNLILRVQIIQ
ncbi:MAG: hypothetical protein AAGE93_11025 [Bacteroidota bacterium]